MVEHEFQTFLSDRRSGDTRWSDREAAVTLESSASCFSEREDPDVPRTSEPRVPKVHRPPEGRRQENVQLHRRRLSGERRLCACVCVCAYKARRRHSGWRSVTTNPPVILHGENQQTAIKCGVLVRHKVGIVCLTLVVVFCPFRLFLLFVGYSRLGLSLRLSLVSNT